MLTVCLSRRHSWLQATGVCRRREAIAPVTTQLAMNALQSSEQGRKQTPHVQDGVQPQQGALFSSQGDDSGISHNTTVTRSGTSNALYFMPMPVATSEQLQDDS